MIDRGANPFVEFSERKPNFDQYCLSYLKNLPSIKSVFFSVKNFPNSNLPEPWHYTTGVYKGNYGKVVGKGGEGTVIEGDWNGKSVAFKFVKTKGLKFNFKYDDHMKDMTKRVTEMTEMMATKGDMILPFLAHFRYILTLIVRKVKSNSDNSWIIAMIPILQSNLK